MTTLFPEIRSGNLGVCVSDESRHIEAAQRLRYQIFFGELGGVSENPDVIAQQRDFDDFDEACDHLLVLDHDLPPETGQVVGTYRLLRRAGMEKTGRFYSEGEFDVSALKEYDGDIMELGRSCVHANYRNRSVMQLLWRGIGEYVAQYRVGIMFGCASFSGLSTQEHALALSYLYHYHLAPEALRPVALKKHFQPINLMPIEQVDKREALRAVPPLIKGYLRLNGWIGDGAFIDPECKSVDVSIVVKTDMVTDKYVKRYKTDGGSDG